MSFPRSLGYDLEGPRRGHAASAPWILVLHGLGDSRHGWKDIGRHLDLPHCGWVFAEAPLEYYQGFSWFDLGAGLDPDLEHIRRSRDLLRALLGELEERRAIACERLVLMGFSQGCVMTLDVGLRHDRRFLGLVGLSGWLAFADEFPAALGSVAREQPLLWTHGRQDPVVPFAAARRQAQAMAGHLPLLEWREYDAEHGLEPGQVLDLRQWLARRTASAAAGPAT